VSRRGGNELRRSIHGEKMYGVSDAMEGLKGSGGKAR
jgi:hypothetical protein